MEASDKIAAKFASPVYRPFKQISILRPPFRPVLGEQLPLCPFPWTPVLILMKRMKIFSQVYV